MIYRRKDNLIVLKILLLFFLPFHLHLAIAQELDLDILNLYLSDNPKTLAFGGVDLNIEKDDVDLYHPVKLVHEDISYLSYFIKDENVYNSDKGQSEDILIKSKEIRMGGAVNFTRDGIIKKCALGFQVGVDDATGHYRLEKDNSNIEYDKTTGTRLFAVGVQAGDFLSFGGGFEEYNKNTHSFWEAGFRAHPFLSFGLRNFQREFNLELVIEEDNTKGCIPIEYSEEVREISMKINFNEWLTAHFVIDEKHMDRKKIGLSSNITERFSLAYFRQHGGFDYHQDLFVDGADSGHNNGEAVYDLWGAGLEFRPAEGTKYRLNVRKLDFSTNGAGLVETNAALSFWENLLAGKRYFNYEFRGKSTQYHLGAESRWTDRLTMRGGLQYIEIKPEGVFDHWTSYPFIGIGKLDEEIMELPYSKITLGVLATGFSYRVKNFEVSYGLGQYIPLSLKKRGEADGVGDGGELYSISWDDIDKAWEKIKENPGGTLQILEVKLYF